MTDENAAAEPLSGVGAGAVSAGVDNGYPPRRVERGYLVITEVETSKLTRHWKVESTSGSRLGCVKFFPRWRCFVFEPLDDCVFNSGCLTDLAAFTDEVTAAWRQEVKDRG